MTAPIGKPTLDEAALNVAESIMLHNAIPMSRDRAESLIAQARLALALEAENARLTADVKAANDLAGDRLLALALRSEDLAAREAEVREARGLVERFAEQAVTMGENELGEEYLTCGECGATDWGSDPDFFDADKHDSACAAKPENMRAAARAFLSRPSSTAALAAFGERVAEAGWMAGAARETPDADAIVARELGRTVTG